MNGRTSKLLRKVAKVIGRSPKYVKQNYKSMTPHQQAVYRFYVKNSLEKISQRKEVVNGKDLPELPGANSPT